MTEAEQRPRVLLVCSPGGHLMQMFCLRDAWDSCDRTWVTLPSPDSEYLLRNERKILAHGPTNRSLRALVANLELAWRVVRRQRPDAILSTGAALALPFFLIGKLFGARLIYVESLTRINELSLTGRMVQPLADAFYVQWPDAAGGGRARFEGAVL
jgi:beta-1,4-N-acetylglucosaminyltransferase